jgi:Zn finger protein HypA/HybF involved in hydrogenase expression
MSTDFDAPRKTEDEPGEDSIEELKTHRTTTQTAVVDEDEAEAADSYELPGADLSGEELTVRVLPAQADEFTCASCFLVRHRSQVAKEKNGMLYCPDCQG